MLIGKATANCTLKNLRAQDIKLISNSSKKNWANNDVVFGCIVGYAEDVELQGCQAIDTTIGTELPTNRYVYAGGLVGNYEGSLTLEECSAQNVLLVVPAADTVRGFSVGNFVGKEIVLDPDAKNSYEGVSVQQGDKKTSVDEFNAGTSQTKIEGLAGPGTEDARKEETESAVSETSAPEQGIEQEPERDAEQQLDQKPEQGAEQQPGDTDKTESAPALSLSGESAGETS